MMKAFEEWHGLNHVRGETIDDFMEEGWKAALEWVKDGIHSGDRGALILEYIEEELEDGR